MQSRETAFVTMMRLDVPDAAPESVEIYVDDGTLVDPDSLGSTSAIVSTDDAPITVTRTELADMIATAVAAAINAQQSAATAPLDIRQAARAALTQEAP